MVVSQPGIQFEIVEPRDLPKEGLNQAFLVEDSWDDWFKFSTGYSLVVFNESGSKVELGMVKIGQFDMKKDQRRADIPSSFKKLGPQFFSLGQDPSYYEALRDFVPALRAAVLVGLRDIVADSALYAQAQSEDVTTVSLMRAVSDKTVTGQFKRILEGGVRLSNYRFSYTAPRRVGSSDQPVKLDFSVQPDSSPPSNIHVLIGRNGVGKTFLLSQMTSCLASDRAKKGAHGSFESLQTFDFFDNDDVTIFSNVISVTFSAFDSFYLPASSNSSANRCLTPHTQTKAPHCGSGSHRGAALLRLAPIVSE